MSYSFSCSSHNLITARHKNSLEFTKDSEVTLKGDCIIGVKADFELDKLLDFIKSNRGKRIRLAVKAGNISDELTFELNPDFHDKHEIVIRKSGFLSKRTLGINASKSAYELAKGLKGVLKECDKMSVEFSSVGSVENKG
ncbi:DUF371 domain-containing protein [Candidatus Woesearchaeota archaeon]|nr:DUF371 domain-containing protein [Candidatus Woesearchaeota archaeon]